MNIEDMTPNQHAQRWNDKVNKLQELGPVFGMVAGMQFGDAKAHMENMTRDELTEWSRELDEMSHLCISMLDAFKTVLVLKVIRALKDGTLNLEDL